MNRGDVVLVADGRGDFSGKPRPALVVQADLFNEVHQSMTVCPLTSICIGGGLFRLSVAPSEANGLKDESEIEIDKLQSVRRTKIGERIGALSVMEMGRVDEALRRWLDL